MSEAQSPDPQAPAGPANDSETTKGLTVDVEGPSTKPDDVEQPGEQIDPAIPTEQSTTAETPGEQLNDASVTDGQQEGLDGPSETTGEQNNGNGTSDSQQGHLSESDQILGTLLDDDGTGSGQQGEPDESTKPPNGSQPSDEQSEDGERPKSPETDLGKTRDGRITKRWNASMKTKQNRGLRNGGVYCYQLSTLQTLFSIPAFSEYLITTHQESCPRDKDCLVCDVQNLRNAYWDGGNSELNRSLDRFHDAVRSTYSASLEGAKDVWDDEQSDPAPFLEHVVNSLRDIDMPGDELTYDTLLDIQHEFHLTCQVCGKISLRSESREDSAYGFIQSVPIATPKRHVRWLTYYLRQLYQTDKRKRCDSEYCLLHPSENEEGALHSERKFLTKAPEIFVIYLMRTLFQPDQYGRYTKIKLSDDIRYEEFLDMGEFTESEEPLLYRLQGIVAHRGEASAGHYIAAVRQNNGRDFITISDNEVECQRRGFVWLLEYPKWKGEDYTTNVLVYTKV